MRLVQLLGDGIEELYNVPDEITDEKIEELWTEYKNSEFEEFEEFLNENYIDLFIERMFVDEIYVK